MKMKFMAMLTTVFMAMTIFVVPTIAFGETDKTTAQGPENNITNPDDFYREPEPEVTVNGTIKINGSEISEQNVLSLYQASKFICDKNDTVQLEVNLSENEEPEKISWFVYTESEIIDLTNTTNTYEIEQITEEAIDNYEYVCIVETASQNYSYTFVPVTKLTSDEVNYEIPEDLIVIDYSFYTKEGRYDYFPISISINDIIEFNNNNNDNIDINIETTSMNTLVDAYGKSLESLRYDDDVLKLTGWEIENQRESIGESPVKNFFGKQTTVKACYTEECNIPVQVIVTYYDKYNKKHNDKIVVPVENIESQTTEYLYNALVENLNKIEHSREYKFKEWDYREGTIIDENERENYQYIEPLRIAAVYEKQPINIKCSYYENDNMVTVTGQGIYTTDMQNTYEAFEKWLSDDPVGKTISTENITGWATSSNNFTQDMIDVAAIYEGNTPSYIYRSRLKYDEADDTYYYVEGEGNPEIVYVDMNYPENSDEINTLCTDSYSSKVYKQVCSEFKAPGSDLTIKKHKVRDARFEDEIINQTSKYIYRCAPEYAMTTVYNKVYVEIVGADGMIQKNFIDQNDSSQNPYTIGKPDEGELWNMEIVDQGGTSIPGGSSIEVVPPYTKFSLWTLSCNPLEKVPDGLNSTFEDIRAIQGKMDDKMLGEMPSSWSEEDIQSEYYEVELMRVVNGMLVHATEDDFKNGIWIMLDYPEGTDKNTQIAISHMFAKNSNGYKAGDVEIITEKTLDKDGKSPRLIKTDKGIKVKMYSLSPMSIAYDPTAINSHDNSGENTTNPVDAGEKSAADSNADETIKTGDSFAVLPIIVIMTIALVGVVAAVFRKKSFK